MGRQKRSISLPPDLAAEIEAAAAEAGLSVSAWIAEVARHRLRLEAGRRGIEEYEAEHGALTDEEIAEGERLVDDLLTRAAATAPGATAPGTTAPGTAAEPRRTA